MSEKIHKTDEEWREVLTPEQFHVLRENGIRAALTECGFLTNPEDTALAVKASYRQRLAEGIAAAIGRYQASL